ncbi:beta strand repeat-containing protein [Streptomyces sioyaensis]|uniref:beta strand repeat-containing protein n=1 Tax=Streptomyces sioyaensis TaxID=67364 RepID=UPI001F30BE62|nr:IPT/TIG domain-containing protein [Streptomyces sioyaensis]
MAVHPSENPPSASAPRPLAAAPPTVTSVSPTSGSTAGGTSVTVTGTGFTGATAVRFGATQATSFTVDSDTQITAVSPQGTGTVQVTVTTSAGTSNQFVTYGYTTLSAPVLSALSPSSGPAAGGTVVTLSGSGFTGATAVRFGAVPASFTVVSSTQIAATAPAGSGTAQVTVTTAGGTSNGVAYTYTSASAPVLSSLNPSSGPAAGGTSVTLTGSGFTGATAVRFGTATASFTVVSATQITATAPAGSGTAQVTVTTPGGTSNGVAFTYTSASVPVLSSVSPNSGTTAGGTTVTLTGTGLAATSAVRFGATAAASFTVVSDTVLTAVAPPGTGTVQVTVTTPGGTSNGVSYTYSVTPTLSSVSPNQGPTSGGNTVTLTGTNLTGTTEVDFGATPATSFTVLSPTQITAVAPAAVAGAVDITVTAPGGTGTLQSSYFFVNAPVLTAVAPLSGPLSGGNTVTLLGTHLVEATEVRFANTAASSFTVVSDSQITAVVPAGVAGAADITVSTAGGTSNPVTYTYVAAPVLTALAPTQGPASGGNTVTLTGTHLSQVTKVLVGTVPVGFTLVSDSHLVADVPAGAVGPVDVTVVGPGGTSGPQSYTRVSSPGI